MIVGGNGCNPLRHYPWLGRGRLRSANDGQSPSSPLEVRDSAQELQCFQTTKHLHKDVQWNVPRIFFFHTNDKLPSPWLQLLLGTILTLPVLEQSYPEFCAAFLSRHLKDHFILAPRLGHSSQASALLSGAISFPSLFILQ